MEDEKCNCGCEEITDKSPESGKISGEDEDLACCDNANRPVMDKGCCEGDQPEEEVACCGGAETQEDAGCGCGGDFPDESLIANPVKPEFIAEPEFFEELEKHAQLMGIVQVGYTQVIPSLVNGKEPLEYPNALVLTYPMSEDIIKTPPGSEAQELNNATYARLGRITYALSDFIRARGFSTQVAHPYGGLLSLSPPGTEGWFRRDWPQRSSNITGAGTPTEDLRYPDQHRESAHHQAGGLFLDTGLL